MSHDFIGNKMTFEEVENIRKYKIRTTNHTESQKIILKPTKSFLDKALDEKQKLNLLHNPGENSIESGTTLAKMFIGIVNPKSN